ncbi:MAG: hypothetical protein K8R11_11090 [Methanococcoides sp.]|nr:hypothetical protein [Methanococcoides sp.]
MPRSFINKKYSFDEMAVWYRNLIQKIPYDPYKLGDEGYITEEQLMELFTGKYYIQERFKGEVFVKGVEGFAYFIYYDGDMSTPVDKVQVGRNNVRTFKNFTGRKLGTSGSVTYFASEFSKETPSIDEIYEILNRYLEMPSLHNDVNKVGIVIKNYGRFGPGKYLFCEYLNPDTYNELIDMDYLIEGFDTISEEELEKAAIYLIKRIPKEDMQKIKILIKQDPEWHITYHFDFGMYIRNLLREGGFRDPFLDDKWFKFLSKAIEYSD